MKYVEFASTIGTKIGTPCHTRGRSAASSVDHERDVYSKLFCLSTLSLVQII